MYVIMFGNDKNLGGRKENIRKKIRRADRQR